MQNKMKKKISIGSLMIFTVVLLFFATAPVPPGCMIDYFVGIGILGVIPVFIGPNKLLRIFGCLAVYLSLHFAVTDYFIGKRDAERFNRQRDLKATTLTINCEPSAPPNTRSPSAQGVGGR
jgi:hypothetical protein